MKCCDPKFDPSRLKKRITLETVTLSQDDSGGEIQTWSTFASVWASLDPKFVKEVSFAQRIEPRTDHEIIFRYQAGVTAKMRVKYGTRYFEIKAIVNPEEANQWLSLLTTERTGT